ncbi:hypothetical protein BPORC_1888 [Bifidobacterium porcinum]|nr:hypothetical protein BPORC_1888 [Bifidobacterium porcinum]
MPVGGVSIWRMTGLWQAGAAQPVGEAGAGGRRNGRCATCVPAASSSVQLCVCTVVSRRAATTSRQPLVGRRAFAVCDPLWSCRSARFVRWLRYHSGLPRFAVARVRTAAGDSASHA